MFQDSIRLARFGTRFSTIRKWTRDVRICPEQDETRMSAPGRKQTWSMPATRLARTATGDQLDWYAQAGRLIPENGKRLPKDDPAREVWRSSSKPTAPSMFRP